MVGAGVLRGDMPITHWDEPAALGDGYLLDVRDPASSPLEASRSREHPLGQ